MSQSLENYFIGQKQELLLEQAEIIGQEYADAFKSGMVDLDRFAFELESLDRYLQARIWMLNRKGQVYVNSGSGEEDLPAFIQEVNLTEIQEVFDGNIVKKEGTFRGYFQEPVLTIGYPIQFANEVVLALFIHASIPEIQSTTADIRKITLIALIISSVIAFVLVFLTSRNLTKEISRINEGVARIAKGDFKKRLAIDRKDELGELANNFNEMAQDLSQLEKLRRDFISNISHDLRSPLTSINGFVKGILDGTIEKEKQEHYLKIVLEESQRLTKLTNDVLDLSKMEGGELELKSTKFDINQLLLNEMDKFEKRIKEKEIDIELELTDEKIHSYGDINAIQRVLYNLFDNAMKFVDHQGKIHIKTHYKDDQVFVHIRNTGSSIAKEDLKCIFDRFHKLDRSRGQDKGGSGLGLSIVKEIIKAHHQKIYVSTSEENGVEFVFTLHAMKK